MAQADVRDPRSTLTALLKNRRFSFVRQMQDAFPRAEIFLVGGCVRDALLGRVSKDYDFVVRGVPLPALQRFLKSIGSVQLVGKTFGVLKFVPTGVRMSHAEAFDIALPRTEFSQGMSGHYRDVTVEFDHRLALDADLARRDFTMNALAFDLVRNEFIDPYGGRDDIKKRIIRSVGSPTRRFAEDYSRMLRALRFSCQLGFSIEEKTDRAIRKEIKKLNKVIDPALIGEKSSEPIRAVPFEVIAREILKSFSARPLHAFDLFDEYGVFAAVMPEMMKMKTCVQDHEWHSEGNVWTHARLTLQILMSKKFEKEFSADARDLLIIMTSFLHDIGKPLTAIKVKKKGKMRLHFYGHDGVGADVARALLTRLRVSSVEGHSIDPDAVHWLIKNHLLLLNSDAKTMRHNTIEKYFLKDPYLGAKLMQLVYIDSLATIRADGKSSLGNYRAMKRRLADVRTRYEGKSTLPPLVSGDELMRALKLPSGPRIGELLRALREEQLAGRIRTKSRALAFLKKYNTPYGSNDRR